MLLNVSVLSPVSMKIFDWMLVVSVSSLLASANKPVVARNPTRSCRRDRTFFICIPFLSILFKKLYSKIMNTAAFESVFTMIYPSNAR